MSQEIWNAVDDYLSQRFSLQDSTLTEALRTNSEAGLPAINVAPNQGKFLQMLATMQQARRILEIGTLGGYSTIWLARALPPEGRLISLEFEPRYAEIARQNLARAGLDGQVEVQVGPALESLPRLEAAGAGPFDLIFIDANKDGYPEYFQWALRLSRKGTLIVADNVVRNGAVADPASQDKLVQGVQRMLRDVAAEPRVSATALQTVGSKGYDGLAFILVTG